MEEIRIYHSLWKNAPVILICFVFAALGIRTLAVHPEKMGLGLWLSLLLFALGGLFMLWLIRNHGVGSPDHFQESDFSMLYYLSHSHFT